MEFPPSHHRHHTTPNHSYPKINHSYGKSVSSSEMKGIDIDKFLKSSTFAYELIAELSKTLTTYWLLVLVLLIMWLVRRPRVSGEVSFFLQHIQTKNTVTPLGITVFHILIVYYST